MVRRVSERSKQFIALPVKLAALVVNLLGLREIFKRFDFLTSVALSLILTGVVVVGFTIVARQSIELAKRDNLEDQDAVRRPYRG